MNSWQFYSNIDKYKSNSMSHAGLKSVSNLATGIKNMKNYGYYNKIDNFYGPGKSRYFYSKDEWDAYQKEKDDMYQKAKDEVRKKNEEQVQKEIDKYKNVNAAQNARAKEEKKGTYALREQYIKELNDKSNKSDRICKKFINIIYESGKNTKQWVIDTLQKNLPEGYTVKSNGDIDIDVEKVYPEIAKRNKEINSKEAKLNYNTKDPDYKERKIDIDHERAKLYEELNEKYYDAVMKAVNHLITDNTEQNSINIRYALWEAINSKEFKDLKGKISDELFSGINYWGFHRPDTRTYEYSAAENKPIVFTYDPKQNKNIRVYD